MRRLYISFKSLVNDFVYSFGRAALLLLVEVQNHTVPVRERRRIRVNIVDNGDRSNSHAEVSVMAFCFPYAASVSTGQYVFASKGSITLHSIILSPPRPSTL